MAAPPKEKKWVNLIEAQTIIAGVTGCDFMETWPALEEALTEEPIRSQKGATDEDGPIELSGEYWSDKDGLWSERTTRPFPRYEVHREDLLRWLNPPVEKDKGGPRPIDLPERIKAIQDILDEERRQHQKPNKEGAIKAVLDAVKFGEDPRGDTYAKAFERLKKKKFH